MKPSPVSICQTVLQIFAFIVATGTSEAWATDPRKTCDQRDKLVDQLTGAPHHERQALILLDQMPGQEHRIELFMNSGEGERHSYTLLRNLHEGDEACIVSAGLVARKFQDKRARDHLILNDENDPEVLDIVTCHGHYVITREYVDKDVCALVAHDETVRYIVSYGRIIADYRASIPWPSN